MNASLFKKLYKSQNKDNVFYLKINDELRVYENHRFILKNIIEQRPFEGSKKTALESRIALQESQERLRSLDYSGTPDEKKEAVAQVVLKERFCKSLQKKFDLDLKEFKIHLYSCFAVLHRLRKIIHNWDRAEPVLAGNDPKSARHRKGRLPEDFALKIRLLNEIDEEHQELIEVLARHGFPLWMPSEEENQIGKEADKHTQLVWEKLLMDKFITIAEPKEFITLVEVNVRERKLSVDMPLPVRPPTVESEKSDLPSPISKAPETELKDSPREASIEMATIRKKRVQKAKEAPEYSERVGDFPISIYDEYREQGMQPWEIDSVYQDLFINEGEELRLIYHKKRPKHRRKKAILASGPTSKWTGAAAFLPALPEESADYQASEKSSDSDEDLPTTLTKKELHRAWFRKKVLSLYAQLLALPTGQDLLSKLIVPASDSERDAYQREFVSKPYFCRLPPTWRELMKGEGVEEEISQEKIDRLFEDTGILLQPIDNPFKQNYFDPSKVSYHLKYTPDAFRHSKESAAPHGKSIAGFPYGLGHEHYLSKVSPDEYEQNTPNQEEEYSLAPPVLHFANLLSSAGRASKGIYLGINQKAYNLQHVENPLRKEMGLKKKHGLSYELPEIKTATLEASFRWYCRGTENFENLEFTEKEPGIQTKRHTGMQ
ncbi:MAG: hypothetical protein MI784_13950 [Cytophagales bacterium]|nr:hypothetical protein [Cytophagales bacterium]